MAYYPIDKKPVKKNPTKMTFKQLALVREWAKGQRKETKDGLFYDMHADYGYIEGTSSPEEGEEMDYYLGEDRDSEKAFYAAITKGDGDFDEFKVLLGFKDVEAAEAFMEMQYGSWRTGIIIETTVRDIAEIASLGSDKAKREKLIVFTNNEDGETPKEAAVRLQVPLPDTTVSGKEYGEYGQGVNESPQLVVRT